MQSWPTAQGQILSSLGSSLAKNHNKEEDPGFIPATQPAHLPGIDLLADLNRSGQAKEFGLKFHWFTSMPLVRLHSQAAKAVPLHRPKGGVQRYSSQPCLKKLFPFRQLLNLSTTQPNGILV